MDEIRVKIKRWTQAIKLAKFHDIAEEINNAVIIDPSDEINKALFKLILHLCQTAQQCDKTNISDGTKVYNITCAICSKLTSIPDVSKFFSGIYHIVRQLIDTKLYKEAMKLGDYLFPNSLFHATCLNSTDMYKKFSNLWYKTIEKLITAFPVLDETNFEFIMTLILYELKLQILSMTDCCTYLLNKIIVYHDKITSFGQHQFNNRFQNTMMNLVMRTKMALGNENKFQTYQYVLHFLNDIVIPKTNFNDIEIIKYRAKRFFVIFKNCVESDRECNECFMMCKLLCETLIRHVNEFTTEHFRAIQIYIDTENAIIQKYGYQNAIKFNSYSITQLLDALVPFWDTREKDNRNNIPEEFIINITALIKHQGSIVSNLELSKCDSCINDCQMRFDIYNNVVMKLKALRIIARYINNLSASFLSTIIEITDECVQCINALRNANCKRWCKLWVICGPLIHNIAVHYEKSRCDEAVHFYTLLATTTIKLNAFDVDSSFIDSDNPLCVSLHRLSNTHYAHGKYDDAMIACALNAYIGYEDEKCKAFRFWACIKYKYPSSHGVTIINCLKSNKTAAEKIGININLKTYHLVTICSREIKGLQEADINLLTSITAVLDLMEAINISPLSYAQGVQRLGYHMLNFHSDDSIIHYINKALINLKLDAESTVVHDLFEGHLKFYEFIENLNEINKTTKTEMQNTKIKLYASNNSNPQGELASNIVPTYTLIHVITVSNMAEKLEKVLKIWMKCYNVVNINVNEFFEPAVIVRTAIIAAEYTRFYQYNNLEIDAWKIAYGLATKFNNEPAIVYITGRCILIRHIDDEWIYHSKKCIEKLMASDDASIIETVAMFKLSLSEFYFCMGLITEANELFNEAIALPNIKFTVNLATYLLSVDILLSHKFNLGYVDDLVKGLYTSLSMDDIESLGRHPREERLYELDILFQFINHVALRMNSLISYREISAHIVRRLSMAQKLGAPLHVAQCLKNLCFIDLSRHCLEDCEVKLQGLEHILMIETVERSMQSNFSPPAIAAQKHLTPTKIIEPVRDVFQNDTSPVLRSKVFVSPHFMSHNNKCQCFHCRNTIYQYLVFSCTHIRAQLYVFQNHVHHALQHFYGAFIIVRKILHLLNKNIGLHHYHDIVEYVLFMLDFARFLKHSVPQNIQEGLDIALHAVDVCEKYKIINNPVYVTARELIFEFRFQNIFENIDYSKFTMENKIDFDEKRYFKDDNDDDSVTICATPIRPVVAKSVQSVRRRKSPPLLTLSKVCIDSNEDDEDITLSSLKPAIDNRITKKKSTKVRPIRREISENDYASNETSDEADSSLTLLNRNVSKRNMNDINNVQTHKKQTNSKDKSKLKKRIFKTSEDVHKVGDKLKKMQISESTHLTNENELTMSDLSIDPLSKNKSTKRYLGRNDNSSIHKRTTQKSSNSRKMSGMNIKLAIDSSSDFANSSSELESNSELSTSAISNVDSNDEIVDCSIEEVRRSRRIATRLTRK